MAKKKVRLDNGSVAFVDGDCMCDACNQKRQASSAARLASELEAEKARNLQLKLEHERLSIKAGRNVVPMTPERQTFAALDKAVADKATAPGVEPLASIVDNLIAQRATTATGFFLHDRNDPAHRAAALAEAHRIRPDITSTPELDAAIVSGTASNINGRDPAMRIQPTNTGGSGGGVAYRVGNYQMPAHEHHLYNADVDQSMLVTLSEQCPTADLTSTSLTALAQTLGGGARTQAFLAKCKLHSLNPARSPDYEKALTLTFTEVGASHVAHAQTVEEGLQIIKRRLGLEFPRDRGKAAAMLFRENRALCEASYRRTAEETVQCDEAGASAENFGAAVTGAIVELGLDPASRADRYRAIEHALKTNPNLVPPQYRRNRQCRNPTPSATTTTAPSTSRPRR